MSTSTFEIKGAGGLLGSKSPPAPVNYPDTLRQSQKASLLYLIGAGQCRGFPDPSDISRFIYLDGVPVKNASGVRNFNLDIDYRVGSPTQSRIPGFEALSKTRSVNNRVFQGVPLEEQILDPKTDAFKITMRVPSLQKQESNGDVVGSTITWKVSVSSNGGPYIEYATEVATEKSNGPFIRDTVYQLQGDAPWTVRVERLTPDSFDPKLANDLFWDVLSEVNWNVGAFADAAIIAVRNVSAKEFSSIPEITIEWLGREVRVPSNYDGLNRTYSGNFNGTLVTKYTDNPAWILYDLITDPVYCAGTPQKYLNVYDYYELALWADSFTPKLSLNANITSQGDAQEVISAVASRLFTIMLKAGNDVRPVIDNLPSFNKAIFGNSNTIEVSGNSFIEAGNFSYSRTSVRNRPAYVNVTYQDTKRFFEPKVKRVSYKPAIEFHKLRGTAPPELDVVAFGCSTEEEATQYGMYILVTQFEQIETATFTTGLEGTRVQPGDNILVMDNTELLDTKQGSGRLVEADRISCQLDRPYLFERGIIYSIQLYDPTTNNIVEVPLINPEKSTDYLLFSGGAIAFDPILESQYAISATNQQAKRYRVLEVQEDEDFSYTLSALNVVQNKWDIINKNAVVSPRAENFLPNPFEIPATPTSLEATTAPSDSFKSNGFLAKVNLIWHIEDPNGLVRNFYIEFKKVDEPGSAYRPLSTSEGAYYTWDGAPPGRYTFRVQSISIAGKRSPFVSLVYNVDAAPPRPSNIAKVSFTLGEDSLTLSWTPVPDVDVINAGNYLVKYLKTTSPLSSFSDGVLVGGNIPGNSNTVTLPKKGGIYQVVARNSAGQLSATPTSVTVEIPEPLVESLLFVLKESATGFLGIRDRVVLNEQNSLKLAFVLNPSTPIQVEPEGFYYFSFGPINFGRLAKAVLDVDRASVNLDEANLWDDIPGLFNSSLDFLIDPSLDKAGSFVEAQISLDGINYGDWQRLGAEKVSLSFWKAKFRLALTSAEENINVLVSELQLKARTDKSQPAISLTSGMSVQVFNYASPFNQPPEIEAYGINLLDDEFIEITAVSSTSFSYAVKNNLGDFIPDRNIKILIQGF